MRSTQPIFTLLWALWLLSSQLPLSAAEGQQPGKGFRHRHLMTSRSSNGATLGQAMSDLFALDVANTYVSHEPGTDIPAARTRVSANTRTVVTAVVFGVFGGIWVAIAASAAYSARRQAKQSPKHRSEPSKRPVRSISAPPPQADILTLPKAKKDDVGIVSMSSLHPQLSRSYFSPRSFFSPKHQQHAEKDASTGADSDSAEGSQIKSAAVPDSPQSPAKPLNGPAAMAGHKLESVLLRRFYQRCNEKGWFTGGFGATAMQIKKGVYLVSPAASSESPAMQLVLSQLTNTPVVLIATPELTQAALEKLDVAEEYTHLLLANNTRLQILNSVQQMPRVKTHQSAALLRQEQALLVWGKTTNEVADKLMELEDQIAGAMALDGIQQKEEPLKAAPAPRGFNYSTPISTYLALAGTMAIIMLMVREIILDALGDGGWYRLAFLAVAAVWLLWLMFLLNFLVGNLRMLFGPVAQAQRNSKFYSAKPPERLTTSVLPHVTIQMPVYMEPLESVIIPTVQSLEQAIQTYEWQGGTASIFICDDGLQLLAPEEATKRQAFYAERGIAWVARPKHGSNGYDRRGRFKKASNMNQALTFSKQVEQVMQMSDVKYSKALKQVMTEQPHIWAGGDICVGDYILLVDADTRVPADCLLDAVSEMQQDPNVAIMQFTTVPFMVVGDYWERGIAYFTNSIYMAIGGSCSGGDVAPFVGHNALLRWSAIQEVAFVEDGIRKFWAEDTVSEDFEQSLRLQVAGYYNRFIGYTEEGFQEGVSLTYYDELMRWQKYAWGCSELVFNPIPQWPRKGPLNKLFIRFLMSNIHFYTKMNILGYISTYYALASAWPMTIVNYLVTGWSLALTNASYFTTSMVVIYACVLVFSILGPLAFVSYQYRLGKRSLGGAAWDALIWTPYMVMFFSGLSYHLSIPVVAHLIGYNMTWGSTPKELEDSNFWTEMRKTVWRLKRCYLIFTLLAIGVVLLATVVPAPWAIRGALSIIPMVIIVGGHLLAPIFLNPFLMRFKF